jgi:moderate conductance mechanosensitive channel
MAAAVAKPTFAEQLVASTEAAWRNLMSLGPREALLNLGATAVVLLVAWGLIWSLRRLLDGWLRRLARAQGEGVPAAQAPHAARATWLLIRAVIAAGALLTILAAWGVDPWVWLTRGGGARLLRLALIAVLATAAVEVAGLVIRRSMEGVARRSRNARRAAQLRTLGPLLTGCVQAILGVVGALTLLSQIGVQIAPLLASAGVVGLAIGFGAQTIVKDFLTGVFLVAEDVVSIGDNVRIADAAGKVEAMTLRTIRLRDVDGTLHIFPYSEAQVIHNRTKTFSSYVFEILVTYGSDVDEALAVMLQVGQALQAEPAFAEKIIEPFEVLGVDRLDATGVLLKARVTTRPADQWAIGREYNRRLKKAFDAAGVEIAYRPPGPPAPTAPTAPQPQAAASRA